MKIKILKSAKIWLLMVGILAIHVLKGPFLYALEDTIIAIVNDNVITLQEFSEFLNTVYLQMKMDGVGAYEIKKTMEELEANGIERLIEEKLILTEANKKGVEVKESAINERLEEVKKKYPSEQDFLKALLTDGSNITDLRNKIADQLKIKFLIEDEVRSKIYVNPQEVTKYYKENFEEFYKPERVELESIHVPFAKEEGGGIERIEKIQTLFQGSSQTKEDFIRLQKEYSPESSLSTLEKGKMLTAIEEAVFQLEEGEVSDVITVPAKGFYLFYIVSKLPVEVAPLEEVKNRIYNKIFQTKYQKRLRRWLDKLKENAFIEIKTTQEEPEHILGKAVGDG